MTTNIFILQITVPVYSVCVCVCVSEYDLRFLRTAREIVWSGNGEDISQFSFFFLSSLNAQLLPRLSDCIVLIFPFISVRNAKLIPFHHLWKWSDNETEYVEQGHRNLIFFKSNYVHSTHLNPIHFIYSLSSSLSKLRMQTLTTRQYSENKLSKDKPKLFFLFWLYRISLLEK